MSGRYVKSFEAEDFEIWHPVMQKYGFVVLNNIFTEAQCDATVAEFFDDLNRRATVSKSSLISQQP